MIEMNLVHLTITDKLDSRDKVTVVVDMQNKTVEFDTDHLSGLTVSFIDIGMLYLLITRLKGDKARLQE